MTVVQASGRLVCRLLSSVGATTLDDDEVYKCVYPEAYPETPAAPVSIWWNAQEKCLCDRFGIVLGEPNLEGHNKMWDGLSSPSIDRLESRSHRFLLVETQ